MTTLQKLTNHLESDHQLEIEITDTSFADYAEFTVWKEDLERETHPSYVLKCAPVVTQEYRVSYYYCNRSGKYKPEGHGKRQLKSQDSTKIGFQCSAYIKVSEHLVNKNVFVKFCSTHYNHDLQLAYLKMPEKTRLEIANKLHMGVDIQRILDDIRDTSEGGINREHLVNRQDVRNVRLQYNIEGISRHSNDLNSVKAWVNEMQSLEYNPVLLFKEQGLLQPEGLDNYAQDDFVLCLQTAFQRDMLNTFGSDTICIDATHGTNMYNFYLITVLVVDEYGEGLPVGWMISNREDSIALIEFFKSIKIVCGNITPKWFMSDDAEQYFNAWRGVFSENKTSKLLCVWHIHRAWCKALHDHIPDKQDQSNVYHMLCVLLQEHDESKFRTMLQAFLTELHTKHNRFYIYFNTTYCSRLAQWATCYRIGCTANTNMFVESFHSVLKVVYLYHKQNRRVDSLLVTLIKIAGNKTFERFRKLEMGKQTHRICEISKRHQAALSLSHTSATLVAENKWKVRSQKKTSNGIHS